MKWSLLELNKYKAQTYTFSEKLDVRKALMHRDSQILGSSQASVDGFLAVEESEYLLHYTLTVTVTLPSTRSLQPVEVPLSLDIDERFMTPEQFAQQATADEQVIILQQSVIDLTESVEDNILLSLPSQVLTAEEKQTKDMPKGQGWAVISEEDYWKRKQNEHTQQTDPRLAKLSEFFQESSENQDKS